MSADAGRDVYSKALTAYLRDRLADPSLEISRHERLSGGAIQENVALDLVCESGTRRESLVLRTDAASGVSVSHSRAHEYELLAAAFDAGVMVPEPLLLCTDTAVTGAPFFLMRRVGGSANPVRLTRGDTLGESGREALVRSLGEQLARVHAIPLDDPRLSFLSAAAHEPDTLGVRVANFRDLLRALDERRPVLDWALEWLSRQRLAPNPLRLCHNDFRTGNLMIEAGELRGVLDWEFAAPGDPHEDIGWFCAPCWRFSAREREAGGLGTRAAFYAGYERASGRRVDGDAVPVWEIVATVRWAIIALQQGARFTSGAEPTLELGLTGRMVAGLEQDLLELVARAAARNSNRAVEGGSAGRAPRSTPSEADVDVREVVGARGVKAVKRAVGSVEGRRDGHAESVDAPGGEALLAAARTALLEDVLPHLPAERRYPALMIANAMGIASRELERVGAVDASAARSGSAGEQVPRIDGSTDLLDAILLARLGEDVRQRLAIADPKRLRPSRRSFGMGEGIGSRADSEGER